MKRFFFLLAIVAMSIGSVMAQNKQLKVEEIGDGKDIYPCGNRHEAQVVFEVNDIFSLSFRSSHDDELEIEIDSVGNRKTYSIVLVTQEPGVDYSRRELTVMATNFDAYTMRLNLKDREKHIYRVSDPYSAFTSPFYSYREKANELFYEGEYQGARDHYRMTMACPEYVTDSVNINQHIADCDSLIMWGLEAEEHQRFAEWEQALECYRKMITLNSSNNTLRQTYSTCLASYQSDCEAEFRNGEHYMVLGSVDDLQRAVECFQNVIDKKCSTHAREAAANLRNVKRQIAKEQDHSRTILYDAGPNQFIGLTYAHFNNRDNKRHGGYITFHLNKEIIDMAAQKSFVEGTPITNDAKLPIGFNYGKANFDNITDNSIEPKDFSYEAQLSFGWTNQLYRWFFIHYGVGYHGGGFYTFDNKKFNLQEADKPKDPSSWGNKTRNSYSKINWFHAPAPEIGLVVKVSRFVLKGTYQYNYWLNTSDFKDGTSRTVVCEDFFKKKTHGFYVGVGFNW